MPGGYAPEAFATAVLPDGRFLLGTCWGTDDAVLDAKTLTWTEPFSSGKADNGHEEGWTQPPAGKGPGLQQPGLPDQPAHRARAAVT